MFTPAKYMCTMSTLRLMSARCLFTTVSYRFTSAKSVHSRFTPKVLSMNTTPKFAYSTHESTMDYTKLMVKGNYVHDKSVVIPGNYIEKMCQINNEIWCSVDDAIHVYSTNCERLREINHSAIESTFGLTYSSLNSQVVVACHNDKGLHQLDAKSGNYVGKVKEGSFSDVCVFNRLLYALDCQTCRVYVFDCSPNHPKWNLVGSLYDLDFTNGHIDDKICVTKAGIYIMSWLNGHLYHYTLSGILKGKYGEFGAVDPGKLDYPLLCGADNHGNVIIADHNNNRVQMFNTGEAQWSIIDLPGGVCKPVHVMVDESTDSVYVSTGETSIGKTLIRYKPKVVL